MTTNIHNMMFKTSALDILHDETRQRGIITLCRKFDAAIGNGIATGVISEFCGPPGCGKTQMCMQLCVNVQIPQSIGGLGGKAVFVDTNQNFRPRRVQEIGSCCSKRYEELSKSTSNGKASTEFTTDNILSRVQYYYCVDHWQLLAIVQRLKDALRTENDLKLIVIDSICSPFRNMYEYTKRTQILYRLLTNLQTMADAHNLAVVLTNDLTTRFDENGGSLICPALGVSFGHKIGQRFLMSPKPQRDGEFTIYLEKTILSPPQNFNFRITQGGIRGLD